MLELFLDNPLNLVLLVPVLYFAYTAIYPALPPKTAGRPTSHEAGYDWMPNEHPECVLYREYTPRDLAQYDGKTAKDGKLGKILLAIERRERVRDDVGAWTMARKERTVFDVSAGRSFYGPDGPYGNFAGRDASRGMAMQSFDEDMLTPLDKPLDKLDDLDKEQEWVRVGRVVAMMVADNPPTETT